MQRLVLIFCFLILSEFMGFSQESTTPAISMNGYVTNLQSFTFQQFNGDWLSDNILHNRLNFEWDYRSNLRTVLELRNRFISGESLKTIPGYAGMITADNGYLDLSYNIASGKSYLLNSTIDRMYVDYTLNKVQLRIGRQRINWGQCFTWNPNDIFNTYSFFDFDYVEKPGCDAMRMQYYTSSTSKLELAVKADSMKKITSALLFRFNQWNYDIQILGGIYRSEDIVAGLGWSGNIGGASFRGEMSYFQPEKRFADTTGILACSVGSEYAISNTFTLQGEIMYNQMKNNDKGSFSDFYYSGLSAKKLSFTPWSLMLQGSWAITPLVNSSFSVMYFPGIRGFFAGPMITWSLTDNIDFSFIAQSFRGRFQHGTTGQYNFGFLRLKVNFGN